MFYEAKITKIGIEKSICSWYKQFDLEPGANIVNLLLLLLPLKIQEDKVSGK